MKTIIKNIVPISLGALLMLIMIISFAMYSPSTSLASRSNFYWKKSSFTSTSTDAYLTPGVGTTTVQIDSYVNGTNQTIDSAILLMNYTASSSVSSAISWNYEYSQDGIDWYADNLNLPYATTTPLSSGINATMANVYTWAYASTTLGTSVPTSTTGGRSLKVFAVPTPTRFLRVKAYVPIGASNGRVHLELVAKGQQY